MTRPEPPPLPPNLQAIVAASPPLLSRRAVAELLSTHLYPVSHRTIDQWGLKTEYQNRHAVVSTEEAFRVGFEKMQDGPTRFPKSLNGPGWWGPEKGATEAPESRRIEGGGAPAKQELGSDVMAERSEYRRKSEDDLLRLWDGIFTNQQEPAMARIVAIDKYWDRAHGVVTKKTEHSGTVVLETQRAARQALIERLNALAVPEPLTIDGEGVEQND